MCVGGVPENPTSKKEIEWIMGKICVCVRQRENSHRETWGRGEKEEK